jgi:hypothetical protein
LWFFHTLHNSFLHRTYLCRCLPFAKIYPSLLICHSKTSYRDNSACAPPVCCGIIYLLRKCAALWMSGLPFNHLIPVPPFHHESPVTLRPSLSPLMSRRSIIML